MIMAQMHPAAAWQKYDDETTKWKHLAQAPQTAATEKK
jgi:hypothetical protein